VTSSRQLKRVVFSWHSARAFITKCCRVNVTSVYIGRLRLMLDHIKFRASRVNVTQIGQEIQERIGTQAKLWQSPSRFSGNLALPNCNARRCALERKIISYPYWESNHMVPWSSSPWPSDHTEWFVLFITFKCLNVSAGIDSLYNVGGRDISPVVPSVLATKILQERDLSPQHLVSLLQCPWSWQLSRDFPVVSGLLCDKSTVLGDMINGTPVNTSRESLCMH